MALIGPLCPCNNWPDRRSSISFHPVRTVLRWGKCSTDDKMSVFLIKTLSMNWLGGALGGIQIILIMNIAFRPVKVCWNAGPPLPLPSGVKMFEYRGQLVSNRCRARKRCIWIKRTRKEKDKQCFLTFIIRSLTDRAHEIWRWGTLSCLLDRELVKPPEC